jgi:putative membrane-bound dehydrogenase-like protein
MNALFLSLALAASAAPAGVLPAGADGKPLNLDFEAGTLKDWTAEGAAFQGQPIKGDTVHARRSDMKAEQQGQFWIGGYEKVGDKATGTLTSVPFKVTHPWASFLVGGGPWAETCVELVLQPRNEVFFRASGAEAENLKRVVVDLRKYAGKQIQIRLVDRHTGGWGHLNFDDFRFYAEKPNFPAHQLRPVQNAKPDEYKFNGLTPEKAAAAMTVPDGFTVSLFAGEPDVHQPVAFTIDDRGRLWVAEAFTYPKRHPHPGPVLPAAERAKGDRILIFEDADGDGKFDKKTTFFEGLNLVSGLEVGFGGVWVGAAPYLLFIPHDAKTDKAGEPKVLLDGWHYEDTHETLNSFTWGPDGWLYGCHGVFTHSRVGKPGTPDDKRTPINAGVWRYHPTKHVFEVFAHGTSNPWGLDYNQYGDFFIEACVIPHLFHIVQGGRYQRQAGQHFNYYTYADIQTIADHLHWQGANPWAGNNKSDSMGGGHAHAGLMCYHGGAWPKEYRGQLFMGNIHGRRVNMDIPKPKGSGYVAGHGRDFLLANDAWARFINLKYGPDGNVYLIDWYDKQACHRPEPEIWDRTNGRIYKISYRGTKPVMGLDLQKCSDAELVKYQLHENAWYARHARRILQERVPAFLNTKRDALIGLGLKDILKNDSNETHRLRALWALYVTEQIGAEMLDWSLFGDASATNRAWVMRLLGQTWFGNGGSAKQAVAHANKFQQRFASLQVQFGGKMTPVELRQVASVAGMVPPAARAGIVRSLVRNIPDTATNDPNLLYLTWYALEPLADGDPAAALKIAAEARLPLLPFMARRVGAIGTPEAINTLVHALGDAANADQQLAYLRGIQEGLKGKRRADMPKAWADAYPKLRVSRNAEVKSQALALAVTFGDENAFAALRSVLTDPQADTARRQQALSALLGARDKQLAGLLQRLVADPKMQAAAVRGLAAYDDPKTPAVLLAAYAGFTPAEKRDALNTLAARAAYAKALLDAVGAKKIPAGDVPAEIIRQLRNLGDKSLEKQIAAVWGTVRDTPADRKKLIASWRKRLTAPYQGPPDLEFGRAVFAKTCQQCHTLYGVGGKVGPDITGANRADLNYLLENIFDPSAVIPKEYAATKLDLVDGRVVTGIIKEETKATLTVVTANETLTVPTADVDRRSTSPLSMMPDDLTKQLAERELRALVAYLRHNAQVPILATPENAKEFFNRKDLTGWDGDKALWTVENGELVGKTKTGLKRNNFLKSTMEVADFRLSVRVKLVPNKENSGIQFRSVPLPDGEMRGPQADIGAGWWGKLYEESGRGLLAKEDRAKLVKVDDWNEYVVEAKGDTVKTWINGQPCVNLTDPKLAKRGVIAFQIHAGGPMEVRFKDIKLEVLTEKK